MSSWIINEFWPNVDSISGFWRRSHVESVICHQDHIMEKKISELNESVSVLTNTLNVFKGDLVKYSNEVVALNWRILLLEQENRCMRANIAAKQHRLSSAERTHIVNRNGEEVYDAMTWGGDFFYITETFQVAKDAEIWSKWKGNGKGSSKINVDSFFIF